MQSPAIHQLAIPTPFRVGDVNVYLLEGDPLTLVDCGPRTTDAQEALDAALANYGYQLQDIEQVIVTHHHSDHVGLVNHVAEASNAHVLAHVYTAPFLTDPHATHDRFNRYFLDIAREGAVPEPVIEVTKQVHNWLEKFINRPFDGYQVIAEGDSIAAGGRQWQVCHTPGHAGDQICLYDEISGVLIASDHLILNISSNPILEPPPTPEPGQPRPKRLLEYMHHMQRVADLQPTIAYSGHGQSIHDVQKLVANRIRFHEERAAKFLDYFENGAAHLWDITQRKFGHLQHEQQFLAISEVLGHIDLLENNGKLTRNYQDGIVYWNKVISH